MADVEVYARPHSFKVVEGGGENEKVTFIPDPNFNPELVPKLHISREVAAESKFISDLLSEFPSVMVDNVTHDDLLSAFTFLNKIVEVLGNLKEGESRMKPVNTTSTDEKTEKEKSEDAQILGFLKERFPESEKQKIGSVFQLLLTVNQLGSTRGVNFIAKYVADMIRGKTPEQIRETFLIVPKE